MLVGAVLSPASLDLVADIAEVCVVPGLQPITPRGRLSHACAITPSRQKALGMDKG